MLIAYRVVCYLSPKPPLTFGLPPSHLGIVCKHPLLSAWRRFCKGGFLFVNSLDLKRIYVTHPLNPPPVRGMRGG